MKTLYIRCPYCRTIKTDGSNQITWTNGAEPIDMVDKQSDPDASNVSDYICKSCLDKQLKDLE
jgi:hypothetical protein